MILSNCLVVSTSKLKRACKLVKFIIFRPLSPQTHLCHKMPNPLTPLCVTSFMDVSKSIFRILGNLNNWEGISTLLYEILTFRASPKSSAQVGTKYQTPHYRTHLKTRHLSARFWAMIWKNGSLCPELGPFGCPLKHLTI